MSQLKLESPGSRVPRQRSPNTVVMLDSKMVDTTEAGWISLDVTGAVERWHRHTHRPMALMVQVEDDKRRSLEPNSYLQSLICDAGKVAACRSDSQFVVLDPTTAAPQPAPLINGENLLGNLNKNNQPLIDISTIEVT